jgi:hypothetical protein
MTSFRFNLPSEKRAPAIEITRKMVEENKLSFEGYSEAIGA